MWRPRQLRDRPPLADCAFERPVTATVAAIADARRAPARISAPPIRQTSAESHTGCRIRRGSRLCRSKFPAPEPRKTKAARGRPHNNALGGLSSHAKGTSAHRGFHGHISALDSSNPSRIAGRLQYSVRTAPTVTSALGSVCDLGSTPSAHKTHRSTASKSIVVAFTLTRPD
jgi:hypothetical protein